MDYKSIDVDAGLDCECEHEQHENAALNHNTWRGSQVRMPTKSAHCLAPTRFRCRGTPQRIERMW